MDVCEAYGGQCSCFVPTADVDSFTGRQCDLCPFYTYVTPQGCAGEFNSSFFIIWFHCKVISYMHAQYVQRVTVYVSLCVCVFVCVSECVSACVSACMCACVCVRVCTYIYTDPMCRFIEML